MFSTGEKKPALKSRFFECGRRERITRIFDACPAGRCSRNVVSLRSAQISFGGSHPREIWAKKNLLIKAGFFKCGRRERITRIFDARPAGRCSRNVVSLRSAQTSFGGSHPREIWAKKNLL